jgi:hypothetical protein
MPCCASTALSCATVTAAGAAISSSHCHQSGNAAPRRYHELRTGGGASGIADAIGGQREGRRLI